MATSKTLTPTNVTIQIPAFTDKPDQRVNSNCIDKEADAINALSDQIANDVVYEKLTLTGHAITTQSGSGAYYSTNMVDLLKTGYLPISVTVGSWSLLSKPIMPFIDNYRYLGFASEDSQIPNIEAWVVYKKV